MQDHQIHVRNVAMWVLAMVLGPLGVTLSARAGFGLPMAEAPAYIIYLKASLTAGKFTFGLAGFIVRAAVLILLLILIRKFKPKYLLPLGTAAMYAVILDGWRNVVGDTVYDKTGMRILACAAGIILTSIAAACFLRTDLPQEVREAFVKEYSDEKGKKMMKVRWIYDLVALAAAVLLSLILLRKFETEAVGAGTLVSAALNIPLTAVTGRLIDGLWKDRENVATPQKELEELRRKEEDEKKKSAEEDEIIP